MTIQKERLETHKTSETLFIGCGGVGSKIVARVAKKCVGHESDNVRFVVFDTNVNDLGKVNNSSAKVTTVQTSSTQTVFEYLADDKEAFQNWFPNNQIIFDKTVSEGAGQVRAISRLALNSVIKTGTINTLYNIIDDLFRKTGESMKQALRVCIVSSAAGGTGSGIVMALAMFIRRYIKQNYPNRAVLIRGLLVLPSVLDSVIETETERDSLRRNAYATVKEINAFMMKGSGFFKVDKDLERFENLSIKFPSTASDGLVDYDALPFDFCFLFDSLDQENATATSLDQYYESAAQSLYEQHIGPMNKDAFSIEDNIIKEICSEGNYGRNRFGGIGASALRYPYEDVVKYIAYRRAIDRIGGEGEAAKWSKYDKIFAKKLKEFKMGKAYDQVLPPQIKDIYVSELYNSEDTFSKQIKKVYLGTKRSDVTKKIESFANKFYDEIIKSVEKSSDIEKCTKEVNGIDSSVDYASGSIKACDNLHSIRRYENAVKENAAFIARNRSEAIFYNETPLMSNFNGYFLETLIKTNDGVAHPNAVRYILYLAESHFCNQIKSNESALTDSEEAIQFYSKNRKNETFDAKFTKHGVVEDTIDAACEAVDSHDASFFQNRQFEQYTKKVSKWLSDYRDEVSMYAEAVARNEAAKIALSYIRSINSELERFFSGFEIKVRELENQIDEIVDSLKYRRGDCIKYVCASEAQLDELYKRAPDSETGMLLPGNLNAKIFDAIKKNVAWYRDNEFENLVDDKRIDIFKEILLEYFCNDVQDSCSELIDINILQAIMLEKKLDVYLDAVKSIDDKNTESSEKRTYVTISDYELDKYIQSVVDTGTRLAAPNIQGVNNSEKRLVRLSCYNSSLENMREKRISTFLPKGSPSESVSKYELRFFSAIYNLTPDKINKFAKPTSVMGKDAGLYFTSYQNYVQNIGPDSTKSMVISLHIDKRWDSIACLPEMDLEYQAQKMMSIHQALLYGFLYEKIKHRYVSSKYPEKKIFVLENLDDELQPLVVSNGTPCDLMYEILDALYNDRSSVKIIEQVIEEKREKDRNKNPDFEKCEFAKALKTLVVADYHKEPTSLFEIPVMYYNSLSCGMRYEGEIATMVQSIISAFNTEVHLRESDDDAKYTYCKLLEEQFELFYKNYTENKSINCGVSFARNSVAELIYKKVKKIIEAEEPLGYEETVARMKSYFKED